MAGSKKLKGVRVGSKRGFKHMPEGDGKMPAFSAKPSAAGSVPAPPSVPIIGHVGAKRLDKAPRGKKC